MQKDKESWPFKVIEGPAENPAIVVDFKGEEKNYTPAENERLRRWWSRSRYLIRSKQQRHEKHKKVYKVTLESIIGHLFNRISIDPNEYQQIRRDLTKKSHTSKRHLMCQTHKQTHNHHRFTMVEFTSA